MSGVRIAAAGGLLGVLVLAGCGAGPGAATADQLPSVPGVDMQDGNVAVRNAAVVFDPEGYQPGDTVPVELAIFNDSDAPVRLVEVSSAAAASVTIAGESGTRLEVPGYGYVEPTLELTGIQTPLDAAGAVPLELGFDDGATFSMEVPVAPPPRRVGEREPLDLHEEH